MCLGKGSMMKLKYPVKKYLVPWFVMVVTTINLIRLGNHAFTAMVLFSGLILYVVMRAAAKQIEKKDKEIETLKRSVLRSSN